MVSKLSLSLLAGMLASGCDDLPEEPVTILARYNRKVKCVEAQDTDDSAGNIYQFKVSEVIMAPQLNENESPSFEKKEFESLKINLQLQHYSCGFADSQQPTKGDQLVMNGVYDQKEVWTDRVLTFYPEIKIWPFER
jgi:hypothetical protein